MAERIPLVGLASAEDLDHLGRLPRGRHQLSREVVARSQRARILLALAEVVAAQGWAATSVSDVVARAGVSRKAFYEQFASLEEAFLAAYEAIDIVIERVAVAALAEAAPREQIAAGLRAYLGTLADEPEFCRLLVIDAAGAGPRVLDRRVDTFRRFAALLAGPVAALRGAPVDERVLVGVLGAVNELVLQEVHAGRGDALTSLEEPLAALIDAVCRP